MREEKTNKQKFKKNETAKEVFLKKDKQTHQNDNC